MARKLALILAASMVSVVFAMAGCSATKTVTQTIPPLTFISPGVTLPGKTVTLPGGVTTLPAVTVTLPGKVTTIPATVVTVPPATITQPAVPTGLNFLPTKPTDFPYGMAALTNCSDCHGPGLYAQFPMAPAWNGSLNGALVNVAIYNVVGGSIQDHTGRTDDQCLTCHTPV
jgi:hypothetical protein